MIFSALLEALIFFTSFSQTDKEVEEKFRQRYTLIDKTDAAAIAAAQQAGKDR